MEISLEDARAKLCFEDDEFVRDIPRWVVTLSNSENVYADDNRSGVEPVSAWLRLKEYVQVAKLHIVKMRIQFLNHIVELPDNQDGYYFARGIMGFWGMSSESYNQFVVGVVLNDKIHIVRYQVPELIPMNQEEREIDWDSPMLIMSDRDGVAKT